MNIKCYEEIPSVKLVGGPSPLDGLVVLQSDRYVCYDNFNVRAADLVCRELGFPAVKDYSAQPIPSAATSDWTQWLSYSKGNDCQNGRFKDCLPKETQCLSNTAVRLRCREPGFLGCYMGDRHTYQALYDSGCNAHSDEECVSTCRWKTGNNDIAIVNERNCICYRSEEYANFISGVKYTHSWTPQNEAKPGREVHCLYNLSVGFWKHPGPVCNGYWDSDITNIGSDMTLPCSQSFFRISSANLLCVRLPGWSTYFPVWNSSVPSCQAVDSARNDNECHYARIGTTPPTNIKGTSNNMPTTGLYTLGTFLCVVLILLVVLSVAWYKRDKKRHRPSQASNQQVEMHPVGTPNQNSSSADHVVLNATGTDAGAEDRSFPTHPGVRESGPRSPGEAHMFDDTCYNSLNFAKSSDGVCAERQNVRIASGSRRAKGELQENEYGKPCPSGEFSKSRNNLSENAYDHTNRASHNNRAQAHNPVHRSISAIPQPNLHSKRKERKASSTIGCATAAPSEDVYYFKVDSGAPKNTKTSNRRHHPEYFDSGEYCILNRDIDSIDYIPNVREVDNLTERRDPKSPISEELYTRVNKKRKKALSAKK
ncbi:uncharacterized protein [Diadema setosum]|uniref:uncharacterized protein n=1 Tax=Diadema setosum TaxID=31175 RepID=UPI003B3A5D4F